ncbi:MAG: hypothetical protein AABY32_05005 [Nanoarchaeota archaeon]
MESKDIIPEYISIKELLKDSIPCNLFEEVMKEREERLSKQLIDPSIVRKNQDWGIIANQVV